MRRPRNVSRGASTFTGPDREGRPVIRVPLEVKGRGSRFTAEVRAESIEQAIRLAIVRHPGCEARVLFPIDPEAFFRRDGACGRNDAAGAAGGGEPAT